MMTAIPEYERSANEQYPIIMHVLYMLVCRNFLKHTHFLLSNAHDSQIHLPILKPFLFVYL